MVLRPFAIAPQTATAPGAASKPGCRRHIIVTRTLGLLSRSRSALEDSHLARLQLRVRARRSSPAALYSRLHCEQRGLELVRGGRGTLARNSGHIAASMALSGPSPVFGSRTYLLAHSDSGVLGHPRLAEGTAVDDDVVTAALDHHGMVWHRHVQLLATREAFFFELGFVPPRAAHHPFAGGVNLRAFVSFRRTSRCCARRGEVHQRAAVGRLTCGCANRESRAARIGQQIVARLSSRLTGDDVWSVVPTARIWSPAKATASASGSRHPWSMTRRCATDVGRSSWASSDAGRRHEMFWTHAQSP